MKPKLNLNEPGSRLACLAVALLLAALPLYWLAWRLAGPGLTIAAWLKCLAGLLAGAGALLLLVLGILLVIEAFQDRAMDIRYRRQRSRRLPAVDGYYECQYCGSRRVRAGDRACPVCGRELERDHLRSGSI